MLGKLAAVVQRIRQRHAKIGGQIHESIKGGGALKKKEKKRGGHCLSLRHPFLPDSRECGMRAMGASDQEFWKRKRSGKGQNQGVLCQEVAEEVPI